MALLEPGTKVAHYTILGKLDTGGMAELYLARQSGPSGFAKVLVLKLILPHLVDSTKFVKMFHNEAKLAAVLNHPNIVQVYDFGVEDQLHYMAMEYIDGHNLSRVVKCYELRDELLPRTIALRIVAQICEALDYAHSLADSSGKPLEIIHRDVSLGNVLLTYSGQVKLVDFGIAKAQSLESFTEKGVLKGKFPYMAPELLRGDTLDRRVDVYALGVTLYRLLLGRRPIEGDNHAALIHRIMNTPPPKPRKLDPTLPKMLEQILLKAIHKERDQRYQTARELRIDLEEFLKGEDPILPYHLAEFMEQLFPHGVDETRLIYQSLAGASPTPSVVEFEKSQGHSDAPPGGAQGDGVHLSSDDLALLNATISTVIEASIEGAEHQAGDEDGAEPSASPLAERSPKNPTRVLEREPAQRHTSPRSPRRALTFTATALLALGLGLILFTPRPLHVSAPAPERSAARDATSTSARHDSGDGVPAADLPGHDLRGGASREMNQPRRPTRRTLLPTPAPPRRKRGLLSLSALPPGLVTLNGKNAGSLPLVQLALAPGKYEARIHSAHHKYEVLREFEIKPGQHHRLKITPRRGMLRVLTRPWALVTLDGKEIGNTPLPPTAVFEGPHRLVLKNNAIGVVKTLTIRVTADQLKVVKVQLLP